MGMNSDLEVELGASGLGGGEPALEHGPAPGLSHDPADVDEVIGGLDDRPHGGGDAMAHLEPRCSTRRCVQYSLQNCKETKRQLKRKTEA